MNEERMKEKGKMGKRKTSWHFEFARERSRGESGAGVETKSEPI